MMVAPVAVPIQGCTERESPATAEVRLTSMAHQNMPPALEARFLAAAAGTMSMAVTSSTPTLHTENMTTRARRAAKRYSKSATGTRCAFAMMLLVPEYSSLLKPNI